MTSPACVLVALLMALPVRAAEPCANDPSEVARLQTHLSTVERKLRAVDTSRLPPQVAARRLQLLDRLHDYWEAGRFPHNHDYAGERIPIFIDAHGTACAVGQLLIDSGSGDLAREVARTRNTARVAELAQLEALRTWAAEWGFELRELARIQPSYGFENSPQYRAELKRRQEEEKKLREWCASRPELFEGTAGQLRPRGARRAFVEKLSAAPGQVWGIGPRGLYRLVNDEWVLAHEQVGLQSVWASKGQVFAAGNSSGPLVGTLDKKEWRFTELSVPLAPSSGSGAFLVTGVGDEAWFHGYGPVYRWSRGSLTQVDTGGYSIRTLALQSRREAWAIGTDASYVLRLLRWNGKAWSPVERPGPRGMVGLFAGATPWLIETQRGVGAIASRLEGTRWVESPLPTPLAEISLWAPRADEAWLLGIPAPGGSYSTGQPHVLFRWQGKAWTEVPSQEGLRFVGGADKALFIPAWGNCPAPEVTPR